MAIRKVVVVKQLLLLSLFTCTGRKEVARRQVIMSIFISVVLFIVSLKNTLSEQWCVYVCVCFYVMFQVVVNYHNVTCKHGNVSIIRS